MPVAWDALSSFAHFEGSHVGRDVQPGFVAQLSSGAGGSKASPGCLGLTA